MNNNSTDFSSFLDTFSGIQNNSSPAVGDYSGISSIGGNSSSLGSVGGSNVLGNIGTGFEALANIAKVWQGFQAIKQGKKQFKFNKALAERNLANQSRLVNQRIGDRQTSRRAFDPNAGYATPEEAVSKYGAIGSI